MPFYTMPVFYYKRPSYVNPVSGPISESSCQYYATKASTYGQTIPKRLSYDNVMSDAALPPCSLQDFMDYLVYVSHDAENLQFILWLTDYTRRFHKLPLVEQEHSPEWLASGMATVEQTKGQKQPTMLERDAKSMEKPRKQVGETQREKQPYRDEITQVIRHYFTEGSPRELNLSYRHRSYIQAALEETTHPTAFEPIKVLIEGVLRNQSHPNFIRWSICNGNKPRVMIIRQATAVFITSYIVGALLLILSSRSRWNRIGLAPLLWTAVVALHMSFHGICMILVYWKEREYRPWELGQIDDEFLAPLDPRQRRNSFTPAGGLDFGIGSGGDSGRSGGSTTLSDLNHTYRTSSQDTKFETDFTLGADDVRNGEIATTTINGSASQTEVGSEWHDGDGDDSDRSTLRARMNPFGPSNVFDHEAWVARWRGIAWWRKGAWTVTLNKLPTKEGSLRALQQRLIYQAWATALLVTVVVTAGVCACPEVGLYAW